MNSIIESIDAEISKLTAARAALASVATSKGKPGPKPRKKRVLSPEGRARIAEAVKKRWAKQKAAAKKK